MLKVRPPHCVALSFYLMSLDIYEVNSNPNQRNSYLDSDSFARLDDETENMFGNMKRKFCEGSSFLSSKCSPIGEAKIRHSLTPLPK